MQKSSLMALGLKVGGSNYEKPDRQLRTMLSDWNLVSLKPHRFEAYRWEQGGRDEDYV